MRRFGFAVVLIIMAAGIYALPLADLLAELLEWGQQHPIGGPITYIVFVVVATVLFLPGSMTMMIGGFLFGFVPGLLYAAIAIPLGAQSAFEFGRWVARPWVRRKAAENRRMRAIESALREQAFLVVVLTRLSLVMPFNLLNYVYGATAVRGRTHLFATAVGMLPAIALFTYLGTLARNLGQILSAEAAPPELAYWLLGAGLIVIFAVVWVIQRTAARVLERHVLDEEGAGSRG